MKKLDEMSPLTRTFVQMGVVVLIVTIFLIVFGQMSQSVDISSIDGGISFTDPSGETYDIVYACVTEMELKDLPDDLGVCLEGESKKRGLSYGTWQSDEYGIYRLCIKTSVKEAIFVWQGNELFVLNYEGKTSTQSFFDALSEAIENTDY